MSDQEVRVETAWEMKRRYPYNPWDGSDSAGAIGLWDGDDEPGKSPGAKLTYGFLHGCEEDN